MAVIGPALVLAFAAWQRRWTTDDGFINYRIVDLLVHGHGPVFNVGQRVEAYTSPLWVFVLAVGDLLLPVRLEYVGVVLGLGLAALGLAGMAAGAARLLGRPTDRWWLPAGTALLLALPPVWDWSTSGLEFGLTLGWLGGVTWVLGRWGTERRRLTAPEGVLVGLGPLVRPDVALYTFGVLAVVLVAGRRTEGWGDRLRTLGWALAIPVAYQLFRMAYFAALLPNTALAKEAGTPRWHEGWAYLANLVGPYWLWIPVVVLVAAAAVALRDVDARRRTAALVLPGVALVHVAYVVRVGGDYAHARLLLPALAALVAPVAVVPARKWLLAPVAAVAVWGLVAATSLRMGKAVVVEHTIIADGRSSIVGSLGVAHPVTLDDQGWGTTSIAKPVGGRRGAWVNGVRLDLRVRPGVAQPVDVESGIGLPGYGQGARVTMFDRLGLANPYVSRLEVDRPGFIGHEKPVPAPWLAALLAEGATDPDQFGGYEFARLLYVSPPGRYDADVRAARAALRCGPLRDLQDATTGPLGPGKLVRNLFRAPSLTFLRIPPDPQVARRELC